MQRLLPYLLGLMTLGCGATAQKLILNKETFVLTTNTSATLTNFALITFGTGSTNGSCKHSGTVTITRTTSTHIDVVFAQCRGSIFPSVNGPAKWQLEGSVGLDLERGGGRNVFVMQGTLSISGLDPASSDIVDLKGLRASMGGSGQLQLSLCGKPTANGTELDFTGERYTLDADDKIVETVQDLGACGA